MSVELFFGEVKCRDVNEIITKYNKKEFKSPFRSTIPLLSLCQSENNNYFDLISLKQDIKIELIFEHKTQVRHGKGNSSHTDLMILSPEICIAVEAKWTEPKYNTVEQWRAKVETENKKLVLSGWLEIISSYTKVNLNYDAIKDLPYQLIHRVASACFQKKNQTKLVYLVFNLKESQKVYYLNSLKSLSQILGNKIDFYLAHYEIEKSAEQNDLELSWKNNESRDLSEQILKSLSNNSLMNISVLTIEHINNFA